MPKIDSLQVFMLNTGLLKPKPPRPPRKRKQPTPAIEWMQEDDDPDISQMNWDSEMEYLTELMHSITKRNNYNNFWNVEGIGMGWRSRSGTAQIRASTGVELLQKILPNTDCHFRIYIDKVRHEIRIQNYHHDSPVGNEWYTIKPMTAKEADSFYSTDA